MLTSTVPIFRLIVASDSVVVDVAAGMVRVKVPDMPVPVGWVRAQVGWPVRVAFTVVKSIDSSGVIFRV